MRRAHELDRLPAFSPARVAPSATSRHLSLPADSLQFGRRLLCIALARLVNEIECHRRSLEPPSPIINRPNGVRLRKLIYECLNEWVRHFAVRSGSTRVRTGVSSRSTLLVTRRLLSFRESTLVSISDMFMACPRITSWPCKKRPANPRRRGLAGPKTKTGWAVVPGFFV